MLKMRIAVEQFIAQKLCETLIIAGYALTVNDGEDDVVVKSCDAWTCVKAMFSTDEDTIFAYKKNEDGNFINKGFVKLIYGNDGHDVINDYSLALEHDIRPVEQWADFIEAGDYVIDIIPAASKAWNKP